MIVVCIIAALAVVVSVLVYDMKQIRQIQKAAQQEISEKPSSWDLVVRHDGRSHNLGPVEALNEARLGGDTRCDVRIFPPDGRSDALIVRRNGRRFFLHNQTADQVEANAIEVKPHAAVRLNLGAQIRYHGKSTALLLVSRKQEQLTKPDPRPAREVKQNENIQRT